MINPYKLMDAKPPYRLEHLTWMNTSFGGIPIQQTWSALFMLGKFIEESSIRFIIELGTGRGGLTQFFKNYCDVETYDLPSDVFSNSVRYSIKQLLLGMGKSMVFCDDGNKPRELIVYARYLKKGDHILVHDYRRPDGISYNDTLIAVNEYGLEFYRQDEFDELGTYILSLKKA